MLWLILAARLPARMILFNVAFALSTSGVSLASQPCVDVHEHRKTQTELHRRLLEIAELNRQADSVMLAASIAHEINSH
jgi:hypothetical protein